jgi:glycerophosphoryl diester phosphodiesterase
MSLQIIGHRGSKATHPENTISGFEHAMASGADGVELDVCVSRDDVLVVTHDTALRDGALVSAHRAADLPLPTLDEVLALQSPEGFWFDVESKDAPAVLLREAIVRSQRRHRVLVRSFDHAILRAFHGLAPEIPLAALIDYSSDEWPAIARDAHAAIISPHHSTVTAERVARAHEAGIRVSVWTANDPRDWDRLAALRVDAIITDDPAAAVRHFR